MNSVALARQLAKLDKVSKFTTPSPWAKRGEDGSLAEIYIEKWPEIKHWIALHVGHNNADLIVALRNNLPAILRALCVMAAVNNIRAESTAPFDYDDVQERADELLADLGVAK